MCEIKWAFQNTSKCQNPTIIDGITLGLGVFWRWFSLIFTSKRRAPTTRGHLIPLNSNQWQWNSGRWFSTSLTVSLSNLVEIGPVVAEILRKAARGFDGHHGNFCVLCPFRFFSHFVLLTTLACMRAGAGNSYLPPNSQSGFPVIFTSPTASG